MPMVKCGCGAWRREETECAYCAYRIARDARRACYAVERRFRIVPPEILRALGMGR